MENLTEYWQEIAKKSGLSEDQIKSVSDALGQEPVSKAFSQAFMTVSDHHSSFDKAKREWETEKQRWNTEKQQYDTWYRETALPEYERFTKSQEALKQYKDLYGELDGGNRQVATPTGDVLTRKEFEEELKRRDQAYVGLTKAASRATLDYYNRFKEPLDLDELEKFAVERSLPLDQAYNAYIQPKVDAANRAEWEVKLKTAREEGYRDAISKARIPVETQPKEYSPFFDPDKPKVDVSDPDAMRRSARDEFFGAWNEAQEVPAGSATGT